MTGRELIKWIQDNNAEDFSVYAGGEADGRFWEPNVRLVHIDPDDKSVMHEGLYFGSDGTDNAISI